MIALDTNVLIRYIVQDDPAQANEATQVVESLKPDHPAFISSIVLCEINWVLKTAYGTSKASCIDVLDKLLSVAVFAVENHDCCLRALKLYRDGPADFSDYLILCVSEKEGCEAVLTFDKRALGYSGFMSPSAFASGK